VCFVNKSHYEQSYMPLLDEPVTTAHCGSYLLLIYALSYNSTATVQLMLLALSEIYVHEILESITYPSAMTIPATASASSSQLYVPVAGSSWHSLTAACT
jgi:hypothetical protein